MSFTCDSCHVEHEEIDLGKNVGKSIDHPHCTGQLCKRCTFGVGNRAERRAQGRRAACSIDCKEQS